MNVPKCEDCKWFKRERSRISSKCENPMRGVENADQERNLTHINNCKREGKLFEQRPPTLADHFKAFVADLLKRPVAKKPEFDFDNYVPESWKQ